MNKIICELFNNPDNSKLFKRIPAKFVGAANIYLIKMNYNYTNQNAYSYLNGCIFKCDADALHATEDDIDILVNVLPAIKYSGSIENNVAEEMNEETSSSSSSDEEDLKPCVTSGNYVKRFKYYDGSWFRLYWNKYLNEWKIATSQLINGEIATWNNVAIGKIFEEYVNSINKDNLNKESTYFFIYSHPFITFDPAVTEEHFQFITEVNNGRIVECNDFETNTEEIDDICNVVQINEDGVEMIIQNEHYQEIKNYFRVDLNTVFINFYAKPNENIHVMKLFFDTCPRFVEPYNKFVNNPMLETLVRTIIDFTTRNICRYFNNMNVKISKLDTSVFKIWCNMLMKVDPCHKWDHKMTPFNNLKTMNIKTIELLTNETYVREYLCNIPIEDVLAVLN